MTAFETHTRQRTDRGFLNATLKALRALAHAIARGQQLHRDYRELTGMSDPELQDIGINRSDIFAVIEGTHQRAARSFSTGQKRMSEARWHSENIRPPSMAEGDAHALKWRSALTAAPFTTGKPSLSSNGFRER